MKHNFKHLNIWKLSIELADEVYVATFSKKRRIWA